MSPSEIMVKISRTKPIIWMYLLRLVTAFGRGFDFSFSMLGTVFGLFVGSLMGSPLIICACLFGAFCMLGFSIKAMRDEYNDQRNLQRLKEKLKSPRYVQHKLALDNNHSHTFVYPKKILNRCREFLNSFNEAIKILIGIAGTCGFTFCAITPFVGTFAVPLLIGTILAGITLGSLVAIEYHLRRKREDKIRQYERIIENARAEKYQLNPHVNKHAYKISTKEEFSNLAKKILCLTCGTFAGVYFGFTIISLFFGIIFSPLPILLPAFPLLATVLIPVGGPILIGIFFANKFFRDENRAQRDEYLAKSKYAQRCAELKALDPTINPVDLTKPSIPPRPTGKLQTIKEKLWLYTKMLGNRMIEAGRGMRNGARVLQFILASNPIVPIVVVVTTGCISLGISGTFGFFALIPFVMFSLAIGALAFMQYSIRSNHRKETQRLRAETRLIEKEIYKLKMSKTSTTLMHTYLDTRKEPVNEEIEFLNSQVSHWHGHVLRQRESSAGFGVCEKPLNREKIDMGNRLQS